MKFEAFVLLLYLLLAVAVIVAIYLIYQEIKKAAPKAARDTVEWAADQWADAKMPKELDATGRAAVYTVAELGFWEALKHPASAFREFVFGDDAAPVQAEGSFGGGSGAGGGATGDW